MEQDNEFKISEAENVAIIGKALLEIDAVARKMGGTVIAPITVPELTDPAVSLVGVTLLFDTKVLHEYAAQSRGQAADTSQG